MIKRQLFGDTVQVTWIDSGISPSSIICAVYDGGEVLVDSGSMTSSGNGHYYFNHTIPDTPGYYVAETLATINALPYKRRVKYQVVLEQVD